VLLALPVLPWAPHARRDRLFVDVESGAALDELVHAAPALLDAMLGARRSLFARSFKSRARSNRSGARGSRVRLLHGLTGTKADRRRRARTPDFTVQGGPTGHERLLHKRFWSGCSCVRLAGMAMVGVREIGLVRGAGGPSGLIELK
jgi:hypothetical protein